MITFIKKYKLEILAAVLFILSRFPDLGNDMFNTDVWKWKSRSYNFGNGVFGLNFEETIQKYHPGVTLMWIGVVGIKIFNLYNDTFLHLSYDSIEAVFGLHFVQKFLVVIVIGITLAFIFYALRRLINTRYAFIATAFLTLEPFYVALTRVFHLEGLMSSFMLASILYFYMWLKEGFKDKKYLFLSSFFSSLAFLTKTSSLYLLAFYGLILLVYAYTQKKSFKYILSNTFITYLKWLLPSLLFVFLLWPALWVNPLKALGEIYRGVALVGVEQDHIQYFFGKLTGNPGVIYYPIVFIFRSSIYLILGLIGLGVFSKKVVNNQNKNFIYYLLAYSIFYIVMISIPTKKLDRYIIPSITSLVLISSFFYIYVLDILNKMKVNKINKINKTHSVLKYVVLFLYPVISLVCIHPDYFSYYNPLIGLKMGIYALEPKWMIGQREVVKYFEKVQQDNNLTRLEGATSFESLISSNEVDNVLSVGFPEKYYTQVWPFFRKFGAWAVITDLTPFAKETKYFVYPVWADDSSSEDRFSIKYVGTIKVRGVDVYNVYIRD